MFSFIFLLGSLDLRHFDFDLASSSSFSLFFKFAIFIEKNLVEKYIAIISIIAAAVDGITRIIPTKKNYSWIHAILNAILTASTFLNNKKK